MRHSTRESLIPLALLSAASGARTLTGVAAVVPRIPARLLAAGELVADKLPNTPNRTDPTGLLGRVAAAAVVGAVVAGRTGGNRAGFAVVGGLIAFASTHATFRLRHALSDYLPAFAAAAVEDAVVIGMAAAGAALLPSRRRTRARRQRQWR